MQYLKKTQNQWTFVQDPEQADHVVVGKKQYERLERANKNKGDQIQRLKRKLQELGVENVQKDFEIISVRHTPWEGNWAIKVSIPLPYDPWMGKLAKEIAEVSLPEEVESRKNCEVILQRKYGWSFTVYLNLEHYEKFSTGQLRFSFPKMELHE